MGRRITAEWRQATAEISDWLPEQP